MPRGVGRWRAYLDRAKARASQLKWDTLALFLAYRDPRVPLRAKVVIALTVGYALSPIDLIPDFIPILGYLDDLVIVPLGIGYATKLVPEDIMRECRERAKIEFKAGTPKSRRAAAVVVGIWAAAIAIVVLLFLRVFH